MDILGEFRTYLKTWCGKNGKPVPDITEKNILWKEAWKDFLKDVLVKDWDKNKEAYLNMQLLTTIEQERLQKEKEINSQLEEDEDINEPKSDWDRVNEFLK